MVDKNTEAVAEHGLTARFLPQPSSMDSGCISMKEPVCPGVLHCLSPAVLCSTLWSTPLPSQHQQAELLQMEALFELLQEQLVHGNIRS